jgi:lipopolysaccharide biosynthesis glycosyltransferase
MTRASNDATSGRVALVTLTDDAFVPATMVCLHSFLAHNPWFEGDLVVLARDLSTRWRDVLSCAFDRLRVVAVSGDLERRIERYVEALPHLAPLRARFRCLETFALRGYDRVLFCDGDVLFRSDVRELFDIDAPLLAAGECLHYAGRGRDAVTLEERQPGEPGTAGVLLNTFNSGLLSLPGTIFIDEEYAGLLDRLDPAHAPARSVRMSFQAIVNLHFAGRQRLISGRFNYLVRCRRLIDAREGLTMDDAAVLHFAGPINPWLASQVLDAGIGDAVMLRAAQLWHEAFVRATAAAHLRTLGSREPAR